MSANAAGKNLKLRLEMKSDWHVGTGAGIPGSIDALLARDLDAFPCVPAKTIVGIWRDAMETLTLGLDGGPEKSDVWQQWLDVIFGSQPNQLGQDEVQALAAQDNLTPRPSILSLEPARLNENLKGAINESGDDKRLKQALTFIKPNTAIDSDSGTAKTESLRFTEMGRIGTVLQSEFALDFNRLENVSKERKQFIEALLVASAALVERIGGNRRRGSGKCEMQLPELMSKAKAVEVLRGANAENIKSIPKVLTSESMSAAPAVADGSVSDIAGAVMSAGSTEPSETHTNSPETNKPNAQTKWKRINYSVKLQTPVAIVTNTLGNVSETLDFIPGTYLLPHITKQLKGISKFVASGDFQVSAATIAVSGERGLPVPKIICYQKVDGGFDKPKTVYNLIRERNLVEDLTEQKKNYREGYISDLDQTGALPFYETTKKTLLMHNTVEDRVQRPTEEVGGVFSRQAIKAGTTLRGEIRFTESIADQVKTLEKFEGDVRLGTSKKDDYGLAELILGFFDEDTSNATPNKELIVYLESDVLLRNSNLRQTNLVEDLTTELEKTLGKGTLTKKEKDSLIQVRRIESWHEGWGFPRPTLTAMAAGSVAAFDIAGTIDPTTLQKLELSGIGERRGEGYGQIRFNPALLTNAINNWTVPTKTKLTANGNKEALAKLKAEIKHTEKLKDFISIVERAAWRDELARAVLKLANDPHKRKEIFGFEIEGKEGRKNSLPSLSQIGGLRSVVGRLKAPKATNVIGWLDHLEATPNRLERWDSRSEKGKDKLKRIRELLTDENKVWVILCETELNGLNVWNTPGELIQSGDTLRKNLWAEAVKSLFDACARAHKRDTED